MALGSGPALAWTPLAADPLPTRNAPEDSLGVFLGGHRLKVLGIHTTLVAAEVVDIQPCRYWLAVMNNPSDPMCNPALLADSVLPVAAIPRTVPLNAGPLTFPGVGLEAGDERTVKDGADVRPVGHTGRIPPPALTRPLTRLSEINFVQVIRLYEGGAKGIRTCRF